MRNSCHRSWQASYLSTKQLAKQRKEASSTDLRQFAKQFAEAKKLECTSWIENDVYDLVDMRTINCRNWVSGRWVLTIKRDKDGNFQKCKARWVLRGFQDKQRYDQQTDSPTATRPGFSLTCQLCAINHWDFGHIDLKTAFLQGEEYDTARDVICQLPPEAGQPPHIGARLKKPAYGMNDAPRRWWNRIDSSLQSYGLRPTRADRCVYILSKSKPKTHSRGEKQPSISITSQEIYEKEIESYLETLLDPVKGSISYEKEVLGVIVLHVDDLFMTGSPEFWTHVGNKLKKDYQIGSEDKNDVVFTGQRIRWQGNTLVVDQDKAVEELSEVHIEKNLSDNTPCTASQHTEYRSLLGSLNWLQSRTQFQIAYKFSRAASAAASPKIGDLRALNKIARTVRAKPMKLMFWPLKGDLRILGMPDASYRNNEDSSSQRGQVIFIAENRSTKVSSSSGGNHHSPKVNTRGSLVDYESTKIKKTTLSTTVAELYSFIKCYGSCLFLKGLWADISGLNVPIHMRTDANNLVTTAQTTHLPDQKETIHMIQMLRTEACSGGIADLGHVTTEHCLSDCLTKHSAKPDNLVKAVETGELLQVDAHAPFRDMLPHKAYLNQWINHNLRVESQVITFLDVLII